jgi:hypothetical protein
VGWAALVVIWSLAFAAPHLYWASGGRAGLGSQAVAADIALQQSWFAAYNVAAGGLAICGAAVAVLLTTGRGRRVRRWLLVVTGTAAVVLLVRGVLGLSLLTVSLLRGTSDEQAPLILLLVEPWFLLGGLAYAGLTVAAVRAAADTSSSASSKRSH